jgi:hypothetical protein
MGLLCVGHATGPGEPADVPAVYVLDGRSLCAACAAPMLAVITAHAPGRHEPTRPAATPEV